MSAGAHGTREATHFEPSGSELRVIPIGGCGEVGLNATLLVDGADALLIDCGVLLGVPNAPGVDRLVPGFEPLHAEGRRLAGVVLTHGHEDHIGALPSLLADVDVPVFGSTLTIALAKAKLEGTRGRSVPQEARRQAHGRLVPVPLGGKVSVGPFSVELIRVTHSLPESAAICVEGRGARVLHSGDFKLDDAPQDGLKTDVGRLRALGELGIDLLLSDSTNSETPGRTIAETEVGLALDRLIGEAQGRVVVACLASHLHRIEGIARAARKHGRRVALIGRSLQEMWRIGIELGHLDVDSTLVIAEERMGSLPRREIVVITTGAQGEPQAGLSRIASGSDTQVRCLPGDRVIISARTIPGNERAVRRLVNQLAGQGVEVITDRMQPVHCSGHACRLEQLELVRLTRPKSFLPIHGERAMLEAHARTASEGGVRPEGIIVVEDGESVVLRDGGVFRGPTEAISRRALDPEGRALDWGDVKARKRIGRGGLVVCSAVIDAATGRALDRPAITTRGVSLGRELEQRIAGAVLAALPNRGVGAPEMASVRGRLEQAIRAVLRKERENLPEVAVQVLAIVPGSGGA